jgi:hypothetical protein
MQSVILEETSKPGVTIINGREFMHNAKGGLDPIGNVKDQYKLEDQTVRKCIEFALNLNAQLSRFRGHTAADLSALDALLGEKYNVTIGGKKGNRTYQTYDGLMKIQVQVSDLITFGPCGRVHAAQAGDRGHSLEEGYGSHPRRHPRDRLQGICPLLQARQP